MLTNQKRHIAICDQIFILADTFLQVVPGARQPHAQDADRCEDDDCREAVAHAKFLSVPSNGRNTPQ